MNGDQLFQSLQTFGLTPEDYGHVVCLLDCWTGCVQSAVLHPDEDHAQRALTIVVASAPMDMATGKLLAGATPTLVGEAWRDWQDICNDAINGATMVAVAYTGSAFESIGFDMDKFADEHRGTMSEDDFHKHLEARLNYALSRQHANRVASMMMDMDDENRAKSMQALEMTYTVLDATDKFLSIVDGQ